MADQRKTSDAPSKPVSLFFVKSTENSVATTSTPPMFSFGGSSTVFRPPLFPSAFFRPSMPFNVPITTSVVSQSVFPPQNPAAHTQFFSKLQSNPASQSTDFKPGDCVLGADGKFKFFIPKELKEDSLQHSEWSTRKTSNKSRSEADTTNNVFSLKAAQRPSESASERNKLRRLISRGSDQGFKKVSHITSIVCMNLPPTFNNSAFLHDHFSKFGIVKRVSCSLKKEQAMIYFDDHASAESAKKNGRILSNEYPPIDIFYFQMKERKSNVGVDDELQSMLTGYADHELLQRPEESPPKSSQKTSPKTSQKAVQKVSQRATLPKLQKIRKTVSNKIPSMESKKPKSNVQPFIDPTEENNLCKLLIHKAVSPEERYRMLDAKDKLMRLGLTKQVDLDTAKDLCGTCPDMCSEKERYRRYFENSLSSFEIPEGKALNHMLIVKEYLRSSADQAEPLPHEVRPLSVLQMTMDYLICNVIDNPNSSPIGEWFDFLWNRTRAIRKDITMQQISNVECTEIVEKCARFHIHCTYALRDEDVSVFDPKINHENLTKCLHTLKIMYKDLAAKNIFCPNEAEFQAYNILLCLTDGSVLSTANNIKAHLRNTPELKFAVSCAMAIVMNNYSAFFKLVENTTYLNACILCQYFPAVRLKAMKIMLRAYCAPNQKEQYPVEDFINILKFADLTDAKQFCEIVGLKIDDFSVYLDKQAFVQPITMFPNMCSRNLVEKHLNRPLSEIINNNLLPANPLDYYTPHDSFVGDYLKNELKQTVSQTAENFEQNMPVAASGSIQDVESDNEVEIIEPEVKVIKEVIYKPFGGFTKVDVRDTKDPDIEIVSYPGRSSTEGLLNRSSPVYSRISDRPHRILNPTALHLVGNKIINDTSSEILRDVASATLTLQQQLLEVSNAKKVLLEQNILLIATDLLRETVKTEIIEVAQKVHRLMEKDKALDEICKDIVEDTVSEVIYDTLEALSVEIIEEEEINLKLMQLKQKLRIKLANWALTKWKNMCVKKKEARKKANFPNCPVFFTQKKDPHIANSFTAFSECKKMTHIMDCSDLCSALKEATAWQPYNLTNSFEKQLNKKVNLPVLAPKTCFYKLLILCDEDENSFDSRQFTKWIQAKFSKGKLVQKDGSDSKLCSLYWLTNKLLERIAICIKSVAINDGTFLQTLDSLRQFSDLEGTCGILLCLSGQNYELKNGWSNNLLQILQSKAPIPKIPVQCLIYSSNYNDIFPVEKALGFIDTISNYWVSHLPTSKNFYSFSHDVLDKLERLIENCPQFPQFVHKPLGYFILDSMAEVFGIVYHDRNRGNLRSQRPQIIIEFLNRVMKQRTNVVSSAELKNISWPLTEIEETECEVSHSWNHDARLSKIKNVMDKLILPNFQGDPAKHEDIKKYIQDLVKDDDTNTWQLHNKMQYYLKKIQSKTKGEHIWADIIHECAHYVAMCQICLNSNEIDVYYSEKTYNDFNLLEEWISILKKHHQTGVLQDDMYVHDTENLNVEMEELETVEMPFSGYKRRLLSDVELTKKRKSDISAKLDQVLANESHSSDLFLNFLDKGSRDKSFITSDGSFQKKIVPKTSRTKSRRQRVKNRLNSTLSAEVKESKKLIQLLEQQANCDPYFSRERIFESDKLLLDSFMEQQTEFDGLLELNNQFFEHRDKKMSHSNLRESFGHETIKYLKEQIQNEQKAEMNFSSVVETLSCS